MSPSSHLFLQYILFWVFFMFISCHNFDAKFVWLSPYFLTRCFILMLFFVFPNLLNFYSNVYSLHIDHYYTPSTLMAPCSLQVNQAERDYITELCRWWNMVMVYIRKVLDKMIWVFIFCSIEIYQIVILTWTTIFMDNCLDND